MPSRGRNRKSIQHSKACVRKIRYETREEALSRLPHVFHAADQEKRLNVYECVVCKGFHIGGTPSWRRPDH